MKNKLVFLVALVILVLNARDIFGQYTIPEKMEWWYNARFGMFIHFGSYSYLSHGEWAFYNENWTKADYQANVSAKFNPLNFDAGTIVRLAEKAGMKYIVITAKHHEGFSMWPTNVESFKDVTGEKIYDLKEFTQFGFRDLLKELKDSCDAMGIKFCLYYSIMDWNHSSQTVSTNFTTMKSDSARLEYIKDMKTQLIELINNYKPYVLWFDGDWTHNTGAPTLSSWWTENDGIALYDTLTKVDPDLIINERVFRGTGLGDFECPEQTVPDSSLDRPWETCQTMNNSWGYNENDNNYKTSVTLIRELVDIISKDGNYLLNIGPEGDGTIPDESVLLLGEIGGWMDIYGNSIYSAVRSPFSVTPSWGRFTRKNGKLFAHVFNWPSNGRLKIPALSNTVNKIYLMNDIDTPLNYSDSLGYYWVSVPKAAPDSINSVIVVGVSGMPEASTEHIDVSGIHLYSEGGNNIPEAGDTLRIKASVLPENATDKTITWSVSDTGIADVDQEGLITAKDYGVISVTAASESTPEVEGRIQIIIGTIEQGENLIQNSNFEAQGEWKVKQPDSSDAVEVIFAQSGDGPQYGNGNFLELKSAGNSTADVLVYQKIIIKRGHTYNFSAAMKDVSPNLTGHWISLVYGVEDPVSSQAGGLNTIAGFSAGEDCNGIYFDGLIEESCACPAEYFTFPASLPSDTVYFGINAGNTGTECEFDLYFDELTLADSSIKIEELDDELTGDNKFTIEQNFPNPFKSSTTISYTIFEAGLVKLKIFDVLGREVVTLVNEMKDAGTYNEKFFSHTGSGGKLSSGVYFYRLWFGGNVVTKKMILVK